jgi:ATP-dependent DNA helicase RecG
MSLEKIRALGAVLRAGAELPPLSSLKGLGPARIRQLNDAGLFTVVDLALFLPRSYDDRRHPRTIGSLYAREGRGRAYGEVQVIAGETFYARGKRVPKIWVEDAGSAESGPPGRGALLCFGRPFLARQMVPGSRWLLAADFSLRFGELQSSAFEVRAAGDRESGGPRGADRSAGEFFRIEPIYRRIDGLSAPQLSKIIAAAVAVVTPTLTDDPELREGAFVRELGELELPDLGSAVGTLHRPENMDDLVPARRRLAYAELQQLVISQRREREHWRRGSSGGGDGALPSRGSAAALSDLQRRLIDILPFDLTADQKTCVEDISRDLDSGGMYRLLQGDVGSGKTLVAVLAALRIIGSGGQAALMVPTEILARQHYGKISRWTPAAVHLLTAAMEPGEQQRVREAAAAGEPALFIGTHSLFSASVAFPALELVIIDEQHRFGVNQRAQLISKASCDNLLMLSATPIPRTLTLSVFGGMEISTIRTLPDGRLPVITHLAAIGREEKVYRAVGARLEAGEQAYFVYPRIEEDDQPSDGDGGALKSAEGMYKEILRRYPDFPAALVHGRVGADQREDIMSRFASGEIRILVATTVIEVGVDVANATAIVIEHAERFGLSALHQLRGRVGRGALQSYCYLVYDPDITEDGKQRLKVMKECTDGFVIAEEDLRIRGPGNIGGIEQSGYIDLEYASLYEDIDLLERLSRSIR